MQFSSAQTWRLTFLLVAVQGLNTVAWNTLGLGTHWVALISQIDGYATLLLTFAIHGTIPGVAPVPMPGTATAPPAG